MSNSQARIEAIFTEAATLFKSKNAAYGDSWRHNGWRGNLSRIMEKTGRLRNMLWRDGNVLLNGGKEHPRETALDMINTLAFMIANMDDGVEYGHEPGAREIPPPFDRELEEFRLSYGDPNITREQMLVMRAQPGALESLAGTQRWPDDAPAMAQVGEQTVANVSVPGEEPPSPRPRRKPGQGSGPRPVTERQS